MIWSGVTLMIASLIVAAWLLGFIPGPTLPLKEDALDNFLLIPFFMLVAGFFLTFGGLLP